MTRQAAFVLTFIAGVLVFSVPCHADSDGYFCTSKGYLAYELRKGITPGVAGHVVRVVRFGAERGIYTAGEVTLQDFQVRTMVCSADHVEISGWGEGAVFIGCMIGTADAPEVSVMECTGESERHFDYHKEGPQPPNLGEMGNPGSVTLESLDPDHRYQLLLNSSSKKVGDNSWEVHHKTELVQIDLRGHASQRLMVYEIRIVAPGACGS